MNELSETGSTKHATGEPASSGLTGGDASGARGSEGDASGARAADGNAAGTRAGQAAVSRASDTAHVGAVRMSVSNLGHRFGSRVLFRMLDIELHGGRPLAVIGANGAGKSTLLRILAGVLRPSRGEIELEIDGRPIAPYRRPLTCGMVAPYLNVYDHFTPEENVGFICRVRGLEHERERARRVLDRVGLYDRRNDQVRTFSSGMLQRVRFACALVSDPPVLILDEPTATLDEAGVRLAHDITDDALHAGRIVIVATNERREAERYDERIRIEDFAP